jgi:hypothetical protein
MGLAERDTIEETPHQKRPEMGTERNGAAGRDSCRGCRQEGQEGGAPQPTAADAASRAAPKAETVTEKLALYDRPFEHTGDDPPLIFKPGAGVVDSGSFAYAVAILVYHREIHHLPSVLA